MGSMKNKAQAQTPADFPSKLTLCDILEAEFIEVVNKGKEIADKEYQALKKVHLDAVREFEKRWLPDLNQREQHKNAAKKKPDDAESQAKEDAARQAQQQQCDELDKPRLRRLLEILRTKPRSALCFSGGGIRSATFCLGVMQGLSHHSLLQEFDYLSTVSGGGYIGSWLSAWRRRIGRTDGIQEIEANLCAKPQETLDGERSEIGHLRSYSNYLSPRLGFLSADTWTLAATVIRNMFLNWMILVPIFAAALLIPRLALDTAEALPANPIGLGVLLVLGLCAAVVSVARIGRYLPSFQQKECTEQIYLKTVLLPLSVSAVLLSTFWAGWIRAGYPIWESGYLFLGAMLHCAGWFFVSDSGRAYVKKMESVAGAGKFLAAFSTGFSEVAKTRDKWFAIAAAGTGLAGGWIAYEIATSEAFQPKEHPELVVCLAFPLVMAIYFLATTLFIGFTSTKTDDQDREWWARSGGWILIVATAWAAASALVIGGQSLVHHGMVKTAAAGGIGGIASGIFGSLVGMSGKTGKNDDAATLAALPLSQKMLNYAAKLAPLVFLLALLLGISVLAEIILWKKVVPPLESHPIHAFAEWTERNTPLPLLSWGGSVGTGLGTAKSWTDSIFQPLEADLHTRQMFWTERHLRWIQDRLWLPVIPLRAAPYATLGLILLAAGLGMLMSRFVNVNTFSLHAMYRNRLIRAYLGAARSEEREETMNRFTGFDEADNFPIHTVPAGKPFHVVNMCLNLVHGQRLAWQERKAETFTASRLHAGSARLGYQRSDTYGNKPDEHDRNPQQHTGITLGTAMAISGAAASPNMGYHSSPLLTFLMTFFNARLGWWLANPDYPGRPYWSDRGPKSALNSLFAEALGNTDDKNPYVYLSDGGHFENLGLYEMVLRRCHIIVVIDAGADPQYQFEDLANAIRKIRVDLGVTIHFDKPLAMRPGMAKGNVHVAIGKIHYECVDDGERSHDWLIYIKPVLDPTLSVDLDQYHSAHADFPQQSTLNQFFDESQFESYRRLGLETIENICGRIGGMDLDAFVTAARKHSREPKHGPHIRAGC
jgi:hypothetical protein